MRGRCAGRRGDAGGAQDGTGYGMARVVGGASGKVPPPSGVGISVCGNLGVSAWLFVIL